jgi:hypothetical protein
MIASGSSGGALRVDKWVAGTTAGTDMLIATDDCGNSASVALIVTEGFSVLPAHATITPGTSFKLEVRGALGELRFKSQALDSGGRISEDGTYTAGKAEGLDLIAVSDLGSGDEALVQYQVASSARLQAVPELIGLPAGASITLRTVDGSGELIWSKLSGPGKLEADVFRVEAAESGVARLEARDRFTGETTELSVRVLTELVRTGKPHGRLTDNANLVTGDFDGDGIDDVALGVPESDLAKPTGGAVFVFKGAAGGLPSEPTWILNGESDTASLGSVLAAGDLDGDGRADLAISEPGADVTVADSGAVLLYKFGASGPEPLRPPLTGLGRGNFGASLAIADVDSDGDADLIVGSPGADLAATSSIRERGVVDVFLQTPASPLPDFGSLRVGGVDLAADGAPKASPSLRFGRAVAVADFNGDGRADLASLGAVNNSLLGGMASAKNQVAVAVHFGRSGAPMFGDGPDLYVLPSNPSDGSEGNWRLQVAPAADGGTPRLLVSADKLDAPDLSGADGGKAASDAGGTYIYDLSGYFGTDASQEKPKQLGRDDAFARVWGDSAGGAAGRSVAVGDVDGDGSLELVLGAPNASTTQKVGDKDMTVSMTGRLLVYPYATLVRGAQLNKPRDTRVGSKAIDALGVAVAAWSVAGSKGVLAYAARASTDLGDFTGRLDAYFGSGALASFKSSEVAIPARLASQQHGAAVEVGVIGGRVRALVGMPGYSGPGAKADGNELGAGQALFYGADAASPGIVMEGASARYTSSDRLAYGGKGVGTDVAMSDWNGDGLLDLIVAAPQLTTPIANNSDYAVLKPECVTSANQANGGAIVLLSQPDGSYREGARLVALSAIGGCEPADAATCKRSNVSRYGMAGGFDFDGDGKQDLLLTRSNGIDIYLGRAPDDAALDKPSLVCDPVFSSPALALAPLVSAPAALGDLDGDGCDEVAVRYANDMRSGVLIAFGFAASGGRCKGRTQASWLRLSGDAETGQSNMQLGVATARAGKLLGDARDFIAISANAFPFEGVSQPAVLLFEAAQLAAKRPASAEALIGARGAGLSAIPLLYRERAPGFGRALAGGADVDGDGIVDLIVSAPGASVNGDGSGAVFGFRGGSGLSGRIDPFLCVVGQGDERAAFGQDISLVANTDETPATLAIGAPLSYRTGTANGTSFLLPFER